MKTNDENSNADLLQRMTTTLHGLQIAAEKHEGATDALSPMLSDGAILLAVLTADQQGMKIPAEIPNQATLWLSHAEPLLKSVEQ